MAQFTGKSIRSSAVLFCSFTLLVLPQSLISCTNFQDGHVVADSPTVETGSKESESDVCEAGSEGESSRLGLKTIAAGVVITTGLGLLAAPVAVPAVVATLGFQSTGIAAGSWAAGFMASYGGLVGGGSACAILQTIGAAGTFAGAGTTAAAGAAVAGSGVILAAGASSVVEGASVVGHYAGEGVKTVSEAVGNAVAGFSAAVDGTVGLFRHLYE